MLKTPTLLILGAGASMPYGFPSGRELRDKLTANVKWDDTYSDLGFNEIEVKQFTDQFRQSELYSIDAFLAIPEMYKRHAKVGRVAIARAILKHESKSGVHLILPPGQEPMGHWYRYLWNSMARDWDEFERNQLRIVTFNYDNSLEQYLATALSVTADRSFEEAIKRIDHLRIKHVYGRLGALGRVVDPKLGTRPYGAKGLEVIQIAAAGLRVMQERDQDADVLTRIAEDVAWADRICFLGFSFDPLNVSRLSFDIVGGRRKGGAAAGPPVLYATTKGLLGLEKASAKATVKFQPLADMENFLDVDNEILLRSRGVFA